MDDNQLTNYMHSRTINAREQAPEAFEENVSPPANAFVHPHPNPPRWSRVIVRSLRTLPLDSEEMVSLDAHINQAVNPSDHSMNGRRQLWVSTLRFCTALLDRHV
jgi:hypothetical protein